MKVVLSWREAIALVAVALVAVIIGLVVLVKVITRWSCGAWPSSDLEFGAFGYVLAVLTLDLPGLIGQTSTGCTLPSGAMWAIPAVTLAVLAVVGIWAAAAWNRRKHSPAALRRDILRRHEVIAQAAEVTREVGAKRAVERGKKVRPRYAAEVGRAFAPEAAAFKLGPSQGKDVWLSLEDATVVLGPPRMGKGFTYVISSIVEAPGPVITTSTRADNMMATILPRSKKGPVYVFDPARVSGRASSLRWSPVLGCEDPQIAAKRADLLIAATGLTEGTNQEFGTKAKKIVQALLHAAAVAEKDLTTLYRWAENPEFAREAVEILDARSDTQWGVGLEATITLPAEQRSAEWFGVPLAFEALDVPDVRAMFDPDTDGELFDPEEFLESDGTLYVIAPPRPQGKKATGVGVLLVMMLEAITDAAHRKAMLTPEGRLDPPLSVVLDEIANIFAWPALPTLMASGSGEGVTVSGIFQSRAQMRSGWGDEGAGTLWEAAGSKVMLGGSGNEKDLKEVSSLVGERTHQDTNASWGAERDTSLAETRTFRAGVSPDELRRLPERTAFLIAGRSRAILVDLIPWTERPFAEDVQQSFAWHKEHPASPIRGQEGPHFPVTGLAKKDEEQLEPVPVEEIEAIVAETEGKDAA